MALRSIALLMCDRRATAGNIGFAAMLTDK